MNTEAILELAEFIEGLEHLTQDKVQSANDGRFYAEIPAGRWFRMDTWLIQQPHEFDCATVGCVAGWASWYWGLAKKQEEGCFVIDSEKVGKIMGLSLDQSTQLFAPRSLHGLGYRNVTPHMAGKVLRTLAKYGEVDWSVIRYCSVCGGDLNWERFDYRPCLCPEGI